MIRRIAVCDDEQEILKQLSLYLGQIQKELSDDFEIFYYTSAAELTAMMPRDIQIVLLDIGMSPMTGMEAARKLRAEGLDFTLIFITSMVEYALEGYDVHAFAFLSKPVLYPALYHQLTEAFQRIDKEQSLKTVMVIDTGNGKETIDLSALVFAEVYQHETSFVFEHGRKTSIMPLAEVEKQTARHGFFRCHKSYVVNFKKISRIDFSTVTVTTGEAVPISKYRRKAFLDAYSSFMGVRF